MLNSPIAPFQTRGIHTEDIPTYASQGGSGTYANGDGSTNCGIPSFATAVAVSVSVLSPSTAGVFKLFRNGDPFQTGNTVIYNTGDYGSTADLIVTSCQTCTEELSIYSTASVHYVLDVIGYFMPPQATALQCMTASGASSNVLPNQYLGLNTVSCPAGYTPTSASISADSNVLFADSYTDSTSGFIYVKSLSTLTQTVSPKLTCCRVPGR